MSEESTQIELLRAEMQGGFRQLGSRLDRTDEKFDALGIKVDALGVRLDQTDAKVDALGVRLDRTDAKVDALGVRLDQTDAKVDALGVHLDRTDAKLDSLVVEMRDFRKEMSGKLNGIASMFIAQENNSVKVEERFVSIENRLDRLEQKDKSA
jgi:chromosome segregation ATPase